MKKRTRKRTALILCVILMLGAVGTAAYALAADNSGEESKQEEKQETSHSGAAEDVEITKDETVYVLTGADGTVQKIIVSDWISNAIGAELSDGLKEFNEEGVKKLVEAVDGDLDGLVERIRATKEVSENYQTFSSTGSSLDGQVKFIYRTDSIETK